MGGSKGSSTVVKAEETVTPAVARDVAQDTASAQANLAEQRSRLRGIRSTYSRFAGTGGGTGSLSSKLG